MRVALTGATGFLGGHVARELIAAGHAVRVLVRRTSRLDNIDDLELERVEGDVTDRASLGAAFEGCQAVVHTAAATSWSPLDDRRTRTVNVEGTQNVLDAARAAGVRRLVHTSTLATIGATAAPRVLDETAAWNLAGVAPYIDTKREAERLALEAGAAGLEVVVVCPGFVLGPGDIYGSSAGIVRNVVRQAVPAYVEGGTSIVDVRDVARGIVAALERGRAGERYILGGDNVTISELMERIGRISGVRPPRRVPYGVAWLAALTADVRARLTGSPQPLSRNLLRASSLYTFASSAKAEAELGYAHRSLDEALEATLRDFLARGKLKPRTPELEALMPAEGEAAAQGARSGGS